MNKADDKRWKVLFKKLPSEAVDDKLMPVIAPTEAEARRLALLGLTLSNLKNEEMKSIEIVSCTEII